MIGSTIRQYRVLEKLGEGGMGEVYLAEDTHLKRNVALKFLPEHLHEDETARKRFLREAQSAAALEHPYICNIKEVTRTDAGQDVIVMEYVQGQTLRDKLEEGGPLPLSDTLRILSQVTDALVLAHKNNIVHRDLKPANIMLTPQGHAKVTDFGLAKRVVAEDETGPDLTSGVTREGAALGTPGYMSPEQVLAKPLDGRSDLFSLGIVFYEMLTGVHPFRRPTAIQTMGAILDEDPEPLTTHLKGTTGPLRETVNRLLAKNPEERLQSAGELAGELEKLSGIRPGMVPWLWPGRGSGWGVAAGLVLGVAVMVSAWMALMGGEGGAGADGLTVSAIAVMPFRNLSGDSTQAYFVEGVTDELTTTLGKIGALMVISPSVTRRYEGTDLALADMARELNVGAVMYGSVMREGGQVRVSAQLIDAETGQNLWAESYQRDMTTILALMGELARAVAEDIQVTLTPEEATRLARVQPVDSAAYDAYLQGMFHWNKLTPESLDLAEQYFDLALEKDSTFALAHAGLAVLWQARVQMRLVPPGVGQPRGLEHAERALELDDGLAEVHESVAAQLTWAEWRSGRWEEAWYHWRRALEINPSYAMANAYYAHFLCIMGLPGEGVPYAEKALDLNPFEGLYWGLYSVTLAFNGRYEESLAAVERTRELDPTQFVSATTAALIGAGMQEEDLNRQRRLFAEDTERVAALERGLAEGGYNGAQLAVADLLSSRYETGSPGSGGASTISLYYLDGWDIEQGMDWFRKTVEEGSQSVPYLLLPPRDRLRAHPEYRQLLEEGLRFPPEVVERYMARPVPTPPDQEAG